MADTRLKVSEEAFQAAITKFDSKKNALTLTCYKISDVVRTLDGSWNGAASEAFKSQFDSLFNNLKSTEQAMDNVITKLKTALNIVTEYEGQITQGFQSAEAGTGYTASF